MKIIGERTLKLVDSVPAFPSRASMQIEWGMPDGGHGPPEFNYAQRCHLSMEARTGRSEKVRNILLTTLRPAGR